MIAMPRSARLLAAGSGLLCAGGGAALLYLLFIDVDPTPPRSPMEILAFIAPALFVHGVVVFIGGLALGTSLFSPAAIMTTGLVMMLAGCFPWAYTPALTGDRRSGESAGMLGTILFLTVGVPGLFIALLGWWTNR